MNPSVESALISGGATIVSVLATATVAIVGFRNSRSTNQATIDAAKVVTNKTIDAAADTNKATIDAAHADVQRTADTTRKGQIADLYSRAIEQLGSDQLDVRIGGIYALERVARESEADHPTVMEVLTAFIRERSHEQWPPPDHPVSREQEPSTRPDVQAAVTVIGRRDKERDMGRIDITGARLTGATLARADLTGASLIRVDLTGADLDHINLTGASLIGADLTDADLNNAILTGAMLTGADLTRAHVTSANLTDARLTDAKWPRHEPVPEGWELDASRGRLKAADTGSSPEEAN